MMLWVLKLCMAIGMITVFSINWLLSLLTELIIYINNKLGGK